MNEFKIDYCHHNSVTAESRQYYIKREDALECLEAMERANKNSDDRYIYAKVIQQVKDIPSADVVEVRHGKWSHDYTKDGIEYNDWFNLHCSVCGETQREAWGKWNYCPNCGARMDGKERENEL